MSRILTQSFVHGWYDKHWKYEESLPMSLIVRWPGTTPAAAKNKPIEQNIGFAPTFPDMANLAVPADIQGTILVPFPKNGTPEYWRDEACYHCYAHPDGHMKPPRNGIRRDKHKRIHFRTTGEWESFDWGNGFEEMKNHYLNLPHGDIVKEKKERLQQERIALGNTVELKATSDYHR